MSTPTPDTAAQVSRAMRRFTGLAFAVAALLLAGCKPIEPWVKPYERERLADPIMALERDPVSGAYLDHVFELREGARGAMGSAGGGCGCN